MNFSFEKLVASLLWYIYIQTISCSTYRARVTYEM